MSNRVSKTCIRTYYARVNTYLDNLSFGDFIRVVHIQEKRHLTF